MEDFFTTEQFGFSSRVKNLVDTLAGQDNSLLVNRNDALQRKIDSNNDRISFMNDRLNAQRDRLLLRFFRLEESIAKIKSNLSVIQTLSGLPPVTAPRSAGP